MSNIPAFQDVFTHGKNALIFDGTVGDLADQMTILSTDADLRKSLSCPYPIDENPLGDFYAYEKHSSWMQSKLIDSISYEILICILANQNEDIDKIINNVYNSKIKNIHVIVIHPIDKQSTETAGWFLGQRCSFYSKTGEQLLPTQIKTRDAILILKASDLLSEDYISRCLQVLEKYDHISYVGSWKHIRDAEIEYLDTFPFDIAPELIPFNKSSSYSRCVMKTTPGKLLIDLLIHALISWVN
jgi:uncharacterized protein YifN (PemK superfamily)